VQIFLTDTRALARPLVIDGVACTLPNDIESATRAGLVDGTPFVLGDDGVYDANLNRFFRACATMGVRSPNSLMAYARDLVTWMRFLAEHRFKSVWQADREDVAAYHAARRHSKPPYRIAASSWNRSVAALEKFYNWALEEELVAQSPFVHGTLWRRATGRAGFVPMRVNRGYEPAARHGDVRFIDLEHYLLFRDVGLRGQSLDRADSSGRYGRHGERNSLFAELLVTTGLRLTEAASLLAMEVPRRQEQSGRAKQRSVPFRVPAAIAKGGKGREVRLPLRLLRRLHDYAELERANVLTRTARRSPDDDAIMFSERDRDALTIGNGGKDGRRARLDLLSPADRSRLIDASGAPAILWLAENGRPMTAAAWEAVFRRASERCRGFGIDIDVTPHILRHVFAVYMLSMLIREQIGTVLDSRMPGHSDAAGAAVYRRMIGDPLQKLQRLMGHASIASTYIYLDSLEESRALVDAAVERWASELGPLVSVGTRQ
jgi:site-specific recombinase XerD